MTKSTLTVDERDRGTPDEWIVRDPTLIRLTGRHPFNAEPPTQELLKHGFLTPSSIHYVRNHGTVPNLQWETHKIEVSGYVHAMRGYLPCIMVEHPMTLSMDEIAALPSVKLPVTLACSGNRRKEQNMIAKSVGFHWGPGAVSTSIWHGVRLAEVLRKCRINWPSSASTTSPSPMTPSSSSSSSEDGSPPSEPRFVCFEGADQLPFGYYGTCIPIQRAMDEYFDVLLAYEMNGERLAPDHGYPLRLIVPGCIGGRAVKWLQRIFVSDKEPDNYYHFHDNRVLPPNVDNSIMASALDAWQKADDLIYDFNVQSVITHPGHGELVPLDRDTAYTVRGYAYSGAGHKIKRVQLSLDGGKTWRLAQLDDDQEEEEHKKLGMEQDRSRFWCWRLWTLDIQMSELVESGGELVCRGWDANNNTQPQTTEWNLMGMMHNAWYNIEQSRHAVVSYRFEHPTVVDEDPSDIGAGGFQNKGWMKPPSHDLLDVTTLGDKVLEEPNPYRFTRAMVAKHKSHGDAWVIVHNKVYDCSAFLDEHPGGPASILSAAGTNVTKVFKQIHSIDSHEIFGNYLLGEVDDCHSDNSGNCSSMSPDLRDSNNNYSNNNNNNNGHFLSPEWQPIRLVKKDSISHDSRIFRFALSSPKIKFGLPTGKHVFLRGKSKNDGKMYVRAYTPISDDDSLPGFAEFLVKVYKPDNVHPQGGHLSQVLDSLEMGETIEVRGPLGSFLYLGHGRWTFGTHSGRACRIVTMAGGTGITPIYQLIRAIAMDPTDRTEVRFIYSNKTEEEILLREELLQLEKKSAGRVKICFTVSDPSEGWKGCKGHIDEKMIREYGTFDDHETLNHAIDTISVMCGPPPMIEKACLPNVIKIYGKEMMRMRTFHF
ncbi:nitrate reductase [Linnemannia elongata]|nr:nitrate reductase [Linnemannia elongata]